MEKTMGTVHAEITLTNAIDSANCARGLIKEQDLRSATVTAIVDTGAMSLVITEELRQTLGLGTVGERTALVANGQRVLCKISEPVEIRWKERFSTLSAVVIPGAEKILLGVIPLEEMDLMVNPVTMELVGAHGDVWEYLIL